MERLQTIWEEGGRPSALMLRTLARRQNVDITVRESQEFVAGQAGRQVLASKLPSNGKIQASREGIRWQIDLIDNSKKRRQPSGHRYIVVCIDSFSRFVFTEAIRDKRPETTLAAYRKIIARNSNKHPAELSLDRGGEWTGIFTAYLEDNGTAVTKKDPQSVNGLSSVDRAIGSIKSIIASYQVNSDAPWSTLLKRSTDTYNERSNAGNYGAAPDDIPDEVVYQKEKDEGRNILHNNEKWRSKVALLRRKGGYRLPEDRSTWPRIDQPRFSRTVKEVDEFVGDHVRATDGTSVAVKKVLPVDKDSGNVEINEELIPNSGRREQQRVALRKYAEALKDRLSQSNNEMTFESVARFLRGQPQWNLTVNMVRLPTEGRVVKFLRLFSFALSGSGNAMVVRLPVAAPRVERPVRGPDIAPRVPRRSLPAATPLIWDPENPKRGGTAGFRRYALYKSATSVGQSRLLGATPMDIRQGIQGGFAQLGEV